MFPELNIIHNFIRQMWALNPWWAVAGMSMLHERAVAFPFQRSGGRRADGLLRSKGVLSVSEVSVQHLRHFLDELFLINFIGVVQAIIPNQMLRRFEDDE
jgi:hypothetical protein